MIITDVNAWEALDSRGRPTVAARVVLADGSQGLALVPSGASAGSHEAVELRDGGTRYGGRGVKKAVANIATVLAPKVIGSTAADVDGILAAADSSRSFSTVGANAVLAVSLAAQRADAAAHGTSLARHLAGDRGPLLLPMPMINILSGGAHAGAVLDVQDFLAVPLGATSFAEAIEWAAAVRDAATRIGLARGHAQSVLVADEGGLGLPLEANRAALGLLTDAIEAAGLTPGTQVAIAVDIAATQFFRDGRYRLACEERELTAEGLVAEIADWCSRYPIVSIEDILAEDDWEGWQQATAELGDRVELIGDDLFVTSGERLRRGIESSVANSVLVKVNQNGLVSGAREVVDLARAAGYRTVVSARSGETEDSWLSDLAVGWRAGQIKVGSTHRSERTAKWNRLLELEATEDTVFAGPWSDGRPAKETTK
ncbi:phosphopyruvate hydratase [Streptomyces sp. NBC_00873]|uniref:phosphopyruvate hydratase n=1 Tax=unclassified Streptomyces TaxID=2593676 RepID=UPI003864D616|nr:phosphopyruvate hydratase [Streptomyces sp. NBC_00873]WTA47835.1 phosphopyruvate hydratase [Streptomyces sp. NBC_00842]